MVARARGQFAATMLPRLILLGLMLTATGGWAAEQQQQPNASFGLRRFVDKIESGEHGSYGGAVGSCIGANCARRQSRDIDDVNGMKLNPEESAEKVEGVAAENEDEEYETGVEEGRGRKGKKGKKGYGKYLIGLAAFSKAVMLYIMIHAVAALAGKALIVAKVALVIASALALKKSLDHKSTYEIVQHPQYSHSQTHSSSIDYDHGGGGGYEGGSRRRRQARR